jgi:hypothetical protein
MDPSFSMEPGAVGPGEGTVRRAQAINKPRSYGNGYTPGPEATSATTQEPIDGARHDKKSPCTSVGPAAYDVSATTMTQNSVATWSCDEAVEWISSVIQRPQKEYAREIRANHITGGSLLRLARYAMQGNQTGDAARIEMAHRLLEKSGIVAVGDQLAILDALPGLVGFDQVHGPQSEALDSMQDTGPFIRNPTTVFNPLASASASTG